MRRADKQNAWMKAEEDQSVFSHTKAWLKEKEETETNVEERKTERLEADESANSNLIANESSNANTVKQSSGRQNNPNMKCVECSAGVSNF